MAASMLLPDRSTGAIGGNCTDEHFGLPSSIQSADVDDAFAVSKKITANRGPAPYDIRGHQCRDSRISGGICQPVAVQP